VLLPPDFQHAYDAGVPEVRDAIDALTQASPTEFLVGAARHDGDRLRAIGALYARELATGEQSVGPYPKNRTWGTLARVQRRDCPGCRLVSGAWLPLDLNGGDP
jgi:hypothetical protein